MSERDYIWKMLERPLLFFSREELEKIRNKTIAVIGIGSVGCIVVELLARFGIKSFKLIDMELFETANINKQIFATKDKTGSWKVDVAKERIKQINPSAKVITFSDKLNKNNIKSILDSVNIVILEADLPSASLLTHAHARINQIPLIAGATQGITLCEIQVFNYSNPKQRGIYEPFRIKILNIVAQKILGLPDLNNINQISQKHLDEIDRQFHGCSVLNFVTNLTGCFAVSETIKLVTGKGKIYCHPKRIQFDIWDMKLRISDAYSFSNMLSFAWSNRNMISKNIWNLIRKILS